MGCIRIYNVEINKSHTDNDAHVAMGNLAPSVKLLISITRDSFLQESA
jgi:hypothetical protein